MRRGKRAAGDLIPWTIAQQFQDEDFPSLSGARIVRIATHPDYQRMEYGSQALKLLRKYYQGCIPNLEKEDAEDDSSALTQVSQVEDSEVDLLQEKIEPKSSLPPLLLKLSERKSENLDYLGVSYGVTESLIKFWKRAKFVPVYLRQTTNDITGEHSCIMLSSLRETPDDWLIAYWKDFRRRFISLLASSFRDYGAGLALSILINQNISLPTETLQKNKLDVYFTSYDLGRLEKYSNNMVDYHMIIDLIPSLARLYFLNLMGNVSFSAVQTAILLSIGLQHKTVDQVVEDLNRNSKNDSNLLLSSQILGLFNRVIRKATEHLTSIVKDSYGNTFEDVNNAENVEVSMEKGSELRKELEAADKELKRKQKIELEKLKQEQFSEEFAIKGSETEWSNALQSSKNKSVLSIKSVKKLSDEGNFSFQENNVEKKKKFKKRKHSL